MNKYAIKLQNSSGTALADVAGMAQNLRYSKTRNRADQISFSVDIGKLNEYLNETGQTALGILGVNQTEVIVSRHGVAQVGGQIMQIDTVIQSDNRTVAVKAVGWLDLFDKRFTSANKEISTPTDAGAIGWTLINDSQNLTNGDFGITQGTIQTTTDRIRTYEYKNVKQALIDLTEVEGGFDMEFTPAKVFNVYTSIGVRREKMAFKYPGNIKGIRVPRTGVQMINDLVVRGQGYGLAQLTSIVENTSSKSAYKVRQAIKDFPEVFLSDTLDEIGAEEIAAAKDPLELLQITVDGNGEYAIGDFGVGDEVRVNIEEVPTLTHVDNYYRVEKIDVQVDENESESITLTLR